MNDTKKFICMKWGDLYGPEYVNRLYSMVCRNSSGSIRFVCLTDDKSGLNSNIECYPCPDIDIPYPHKIRGWRKVTLFSKRDKLYDLSGDWLYLDLDIVVTGSLDDFFLYETCETFIVMKNWTQPRSGIGNTSVYRFRVGRHKYLLEDLLRNDKTIIGKFKNSQTYISRKIKKINFWPDQWCKLFKVDCVPTWPKRFWTDPYLPKGAKVIAFPGVPNPHDAELGNWPEKKLHKKIYKKIRPTGWISDHWR